MDARQHVGATHGAKELDTGQPVHGRRCVLCAAVSLDGAVPALVVDEDLRLVRNAPNAWLSSLKCSPREREIEKANQSLLPCSHAKKELDRMRENGRV